QSPPRRKQEVGIDVRVPTLKRTADQTYVQRRGACFAKKVHGLVVRAHAAGHPAVAKPPGIEERPQICLAILRVESFSACEAPRLLRPVRKWRAAQVITNLFQPRSYRPHALPLHQYDRMIYVIDAIEWRKSTDAEVPVGPEYGKPGRPFSRHCCHLASHEIERLRG